MTAAPSASLPPHVLRVEPGEGLRIVRRSPRWSTPKRWLFTLPVLAVAVRAAFPHPVPFPGMGWALLLVLGMVLWSLPVWRPLVPPERFTGMRHVRREVWIRAEAPEAPPSIRVDGELVGDAKTASVWIYKIVRAIVDGRQFYVVTVYSLALLVDGTIYEIARDRDASALRPYATLAAQALAGSGAATVREVDAAGDPRNDASETTSLASLVAAFIASAASHLPGDDPRLLAVGVLACAARASVALDTFARHFMARQLDAKRFAKTFPGARPARPVLWLEARTGKRILIAAHALLFAAVALVLAWRG